MATRRLTHPASGQEIEARAEQVPTYQSQGWQTKPSASPRRSRKRGPVKAPPTPAPNPDTASD